MRKTEYPLSTVLLATFLGFSMGFLACYKVLVGVEKINFNVNRTMEKK